MYGDGQGYGDVPRGRSHGPQQWRSSGSDRSRQRPPEPLPETEVLRGRRNRPSRGRPPQARRSKPRPVGRPHWGKRVRAALLAVLVLFVALLVYVEFSLSRTPALPSDSKA